MKESSIVYPSDRKFGLTFAVVLLLLTAWALWKAAPWWGYSLTAAVILGVLGLAAPRSLRALNVSWMWLGQQLNRLVSPVVMGAIFFAVITPVALLMRLRGRDVLRRRLEPSERTYWIERNPPGPDIANFPRQF